ncbi:MAG TPA: CPBP family intramembrane glutamic endopeptidase [Puia sp.]|nr:CPBP family intramembrane glutamic endopeptidase [Puia sp.]
MTDILDDITNNVKPRSPWAQLGLFLWLFGAAFVVVVMIQLMAAGLPQSYTMKKGLQMISTIIWFGAPAFFYARLSFPDRALDHLGFRPAVRTNFYLLSILLLVCSFPLEGWLGVLNRQLPQASWMLRAEEAAEKEIMAILTVKNSFDIVLNLLVVAVIPAIFEELCFRGVLQPIFIRLTKNPWAGIVLTAFWFSFLHFEFSGFLPRMFLGILLGAAFWYSGSLWTCILGHCIFNGVQVLLVNVYPEAMNNKNPSIPVYTILISLVIVVSLLAVMRRQSVQARAVDVNSV